MTALARAFVAIVPPARVLDAMEAALAPLRAMPGVRWTSRAHWHLTLRFLGPVPDVEALSAAATVAFAGASPPTVALGGLGAFPFARRATVVWVGVTSGEDGLADLAARADQAAGSVGLVADEGREYRPHVTVARAARPVDARTVTEADPLPIGAPWVADEVVLFESTLGRDGARHVARTRFTLTAPER